MIELRPLLAGNHPYPTRRRLRAGIRALELPEPTTPYEVAGADYIIADGLRALQSLDDLGWDANALCMAAIRELQGRRERLPKVDADYWTKTRVRGACRLRRILAELRAAPETHTRPTAAVEHIRQVLNACSDDELVSFEATLIAMFCERYLDGGDPSILRPRAAPRAVFDAVLDDVDDVHDIDAEFAPPSGSAN